MMMMMMTTLDFGLASDIKLSSDGDFFSLSPSAGDDSCSSGSCRELPIGSAIGGSGNRLVVVVAAALIRSRPLPLLLLLWLIV